VGSFDGKSGDKKSHASEPLMRKDRGVTWYQSIRFPLRKFRQECFLNFQSGAICKSAEMIQQHEIVKYLLFS
jgi:hypothetical protein